MVNHSHRTTESHALVLSNCRRRHSSDHETQIVFIGGSHQLASKSGAETVPRLEGGHETFVQDNPDLRRAALAYPNVSVDTRSKLDPVRILRNGTRTFATVGPYSLACIGSLHRLPKRPPCAVCNCVVAIEDCGPEWIAWTDPPP